MINDFQLSENFNLQEFQCRHCGQVKLNKRLVEKLQQLRDIAKRPIVINSGFRCAEHNAAVGGADRSLHMQGQAVDFAIRQTGMNAQQLLDLCNQVGFTGIGVYQQQGFIHVDIRDGQTVIFRRS